ncbi:hypothetical protein HYG93_07435 [Acinetobacter sp. SwsAc6]|uniref:hypothetical protein n=1 Tax=Acinetobacter sp. SwsAc6 TaxID=2749439 RepID=UPI0015BDF8C3|nr:hypothetical protein [Acinetobacter sp. SwsAc6]NWK74121.1 hypothetical protein [Acinetobacter sp. SwsAc6]
MSNYQDITSELAIASDKTWSNTAFFTEEFARLADTQFVRISAKIEERALASDFDLGQIVYIIYEQAALSDHAFGAAHSYGYVLEQATLTDKPFSGISAMAVTETAYASDLQFYIQSHRMLESATTTDTAFGQRAVATQVSENAVLTDTAYKSLIDSVQEQALAQDLLSGSRHSYFLTLESATTADIDQSIQLGTYRINETAVMSDMQFGLKYAHFMVLESAFITDSYVQTQSHAQAWTANTDNWAMSRYAPYNFEGATVINGQLHLWNEQGVYVAGLEGEQISAELKTGKIDFGDSLVHPQAAYLEYSSNGNLPIAVDVSTTQTGAEQTFKYFMPQETSQQLTNGRAVFGRGLRGRHFTFALSIQGSAAHINALSFDYTNTKRRI